MRLRAIMGTLKDGAALLSSAAPTSATAARDPGRQPPRSSAPSSPRLSGTRDAAVAIKCLVSIHYVARRGSFILRDQLLAALQLPPSVGGRNPLNLSGFVDRSATDWWALSRLARWLARVIEHLLAFHRAAGSSLRRRRRPTRAEQEERAAALPNGQVLEEMEALVGLVEEIRGEPDVSHVTGKRLAVQVAALILVRMKEMGERLDCLVFGEAVRLTCLIKRLETCKRSTAAAPPPRGRGDSGAVRGRLESLGGSGVGEGQDFAAAGEDVKGDQLRRERISASARIGDRPPSLESSFDSVRFSSTRWPAN
ncbi:unnamed protein product [Spirodela intermedia]|uniref:Uncharacterized protein n=1 Tax=Spirodela intermedia TaxID=51605 RepID=A0A7I8IHA3_SPIIN|nr:unnamed protein product [Spirodela intermedia]CAA6657263.1 unnamed protein product [Spirodela intermedia]